MGQELGETGRRRIQTVNPEYLSSLGSLGPSFMLHVITTQLCRSAFMHFVLAWGSSPATTSPSHPPATVLYLTREDAGYVVIKILRLTINT